MNKKEVMIEELEMEIMVCRQMIQECEEGLAYLNSDSYDPASNSDDEYRETDVQDYENQIAEYRQIIEKNRKILKRLGG
jgi:hypothetical protein